MGFLKRSFAVFVVAFPVISLAGEDKIQTYFDALPAEVDNAHFRSMSIRQGAISQKKMPDRTQPKEQRAAAGSLTYLQISYVGSSNAGWEYVEGYPVATNLDHGGPLLRIVTDELGYGGNPVPLFNGGTWPLTSNYYTQPICVDAYGYYTLSCSAGQSIAGWRKYWSLDGYQNGWFSYQNTSTNSPWNTMSDSMNIR